MKCSAPKITIDRAALKQGFWGNTWKNWGWILLAFLILYGIEAGYFTGLLFASKRIRGTSMYRTLPSQYFGDFERSQLSSPFIYPDAAPADIFNAPKDCVDITNEVNVSAINDTITKSTGVQKCGTTKNNLAWTIFPWVKDTKAAGNFPACAEGATLLTEETSPAFSGTGVAPASEACQNFVIASYPAAAAPKTAP